MTKHEFEVAMTCEGCSGAVTRILNKLGDEVKFEIDLPKKSEVQRSQVKTHSLLKFNLLSQNAQQRPLLSTDLHHSCTGPQQRHSVYNRSINHTFN
uniref:Copper transport protein ATOX1 n=1 Tax=Knipowitschia caucasica TaxID=637954 RepID=A0AAV2MLP2_KNICA